MPNKPKTSQNSGFTIIEVLIVLAIAGLIMLLVFEAIPTLQRANRNGERKQDVAKILEAVSHYELNNSADFPPTTPPTPAFLSSVHLVFYSASAVSINTITSSPPANNNINSVQVFSSNKCAANGGATNQGADYRNAVALYAVENGNGGGTPQCQQL